MYETNKEFGSFTNGYFLMKLVDSLQIDFNN